jgi:hypothetical protein
LIVGRQNVVPSSTHFAAFKRYDTIGEGMKIRAAEVGRPAFQGIGDGNLDVL